MDMEEARENARVMFEQPGDIPENNSADTGEKAPEEATEAANMQEETGNPIPTAQNVQNTVQNVQAPVQTEQEAQLQQILAENTQLRKTNEELQKTITQQSEIAQKATEERIMPTLDLSAMAFDDEETISAKQTEYAEAMEKYVTDGVMEKLAPYIDRAKAGMRSEEKERVVSLLADTPELRDIRDFLPQIENIIANNPKMFSESVPMDDQLITAYAIARGANSINTPPPSEPTVDELMALYDKNSEFRDRIERQRLEQLRDSQQVPQMSASSGAGNAALNIKKKPETISDASERARLLFGKR